MRKQLLIACFMAGAFSAFAQSPSTGIPDSVQNVARTGSTGSYAISNPLSHTGSGFNNAPTTVNCITNCKADHLYFYDLDLNVPSNATITGIEVIHTRGACNSGSHVIDSLHLAYNGAIISTAKRDSASTFETDTLGAGNDLWSAALTPAIVNSNSFGLFITTTGTGICTFAQSDVRVKVYYCLQMVAAIPDSVQNVSFPNSTGSYNISNPLSHNGSQFTNAPTTTNCISNCHADYLYFYDLDLNIPSTATIVGIEVIHQRGGCNSGSYMIDSLRLAHNGAIISAAKRDSASGFTSDTLGSPGDLWSASLTPAIVNSNSFGVFINSTGTGICTFGQFDLRVNVYYCDATITGIATSSLTKNISVYPNPVTGHLRLQAEDNMTGSSYAIYDITGKTILNGKIEAVTTRIETSSLPAGVYLIRVNETGSSARFIKQ